MERPSKPLPGAPGEGSGEKETLWGKARTQKHDLLASFPGQGEEKACAHAGISFVAT